MRPQINFNNLLTFSITCRDLISIIIMILVSLLIMLIVPSITFAQYQSPIHHIQYSDPNSLAFWRDTKIAKEKAKKLNNLGVEIANRFEMNMLELRDFQHWLDQSFDEVKVEFSRCFNTSSINPNQINVEIKKRPFDTLLDYGVSGVAYVDGRIIIVYWNISDVVGIQTAIKLLKGEMRHYFYLKLTNHYRELWNVEDVCQ